jgi:hypothetical protein
MEEHQRAVEVLDAALACVRVTEETLRRAVKALRETAL